MMRDTGDCALSRSFQRRPNRLRGWLHRAELDHALLGRVEQLLTCEPEMIGALVRAEPAEYLRLKHNLAGLVERYVAAVDAATEARDAIEKTFAAE